MKDQRSRAPASVGNIYRLDGRVPVGKAIPFGLQHVLAMFVANVTPVMLIASVAVYNGQAFTAIDTALLIQAAMLIAGIGTLIQLYPVWRIGSRLPVVMGLSFTFLSAMMTLAAKDYGLMIGAVIVGGCIEGVLGLTAKYWRRFVSPIVSASACCPRAFPRSPAPPSTPPARGRICWSRSSRWRPAWSITRSPRASGNSCMCCSA